MKIFKILVSLILVLSFSSICFGASSTTFSMGPNRQIISGSRTLTDGVATSIFTVSMPASSMFACEIVYFITVTEGTDFQSHKGIVLITAVNKAGTFTTDATHPASGESAATSVGTLSDSWTISTGASLITISLNADTSIAGATLTLYYFIHLGTDNVITLSP